MEDQCNKTCFSNDSGNCGCIGYAYVPVQMLDKTYCPEEGLENGTIFPELKLSICEYGKVCKKLGGAW